MQSSSDRHTPSSGSQTRHKYWEVKLWFCNYLNTFYLRVFHDFKTFFTIFFGNLLHYGDSLKLSGMCNAICIVISCLITVNVQRNSRIATLCTVTEIIYSVSALTVSSNCRFSQCQGRGIVTVEKMFFLS